MNYKNSILRDTYSNTNPHNGNGGNRRTAQLAELIDLAGFMVCDINKDLSMNRWLRGLNGIKFILKEKFPIFPSSDRIGYCGLQYKIYQDALTNHLGHKLLLWEGIQNHLSAYLSKKANFKIIATPQNLEHLDINLVDRITREAFPKSFENEIKYLNQADAVFCIAREEQWLLRLRGINADFLPYYPTSTILSSLERVHHARENSHDRNHKFLILGTANHPPTFLGMVELLKWLKQLNKQINFEVDIAGYGTEKLKDYCDRSNFTLHGSVDSEKLNQLLINTKAVLVHQKAGLGALTRIPEMLIAGIPVIGNSIACRSAFEYSGVYPYDNERELAELIARQLEPPKLFARPYKAEKRFIDCIKRLID